MDGLSCSYFADVEVREKVDVAEIHKCAYFRDFGYYIAYNLQF